MNMEFWWNIGGMWEPGGGGAEVQGVKNLFYCHFVHIIGLLKQNITQHITRRKIRTKTEECVLHEE